MVVYTWWCLRSCRSIAPVAMVTLMLTGCLEVGTPLVAERSPVLKPLPLETPASATRLYTVRKGDTVFSIAWRFQLDYKGLARANSIRPPYAIHPGQELRLRSQLPVKRRVLAKVVVPKPNRRVTDTTTSGGEISLSKWVWPVSVKPDVEFGRNSKGMDFRLPTSANDTVIKAANRGDVVYAGNGIGGFERLLIIRHPGDLLSAYSFNGRVRVIEQQQVKAGATIADISSSGRIKQHLHFELRKDGQPINPRSLLR